MEESSVFQTLSELDNLLQGLHKAVPVDAEKLQSVLLCRSDLWKKLGTEEEAEKVKSASEVFLSIREFVKTNVGQAVEVVLNDLHRAHGEVEKLRASCREAGKFDDPAADEVLLPTQKLKLALKRLNEFKDLQKASSDDEESFSTEFMRTSGVGSKLLAAGRMLISHAEVFANVSQTSTDVEELRLSEGGREASNKLPQEVLMAAREVADEIRSALNEALSITGLSGSSAKRELNLSERRKLDHLGVAYDIAPSPLEVKRSEQSEDEEEDDAFDNDELTDFRRLQTVDPSKKGIAAADEEQQQQQSLSRGWTINLGLADRLAHQNLQLKKRVQEMEESKEELKEAWEKSRQKLGSMGEKLVDVCVQLEEEAVATHAAENRVRSQGRRLEERQKTIEHLEEQRQMHLQELQKLNEKLRLLDDENSKLKSQLSLTIPTDAA